MNKAYLSVPWVKLDGLQIPDDFIGDDPETKRAWANLMLGEGFNFAGWLISLGKDGQFSQNDALSPVRIHDVPAAHTIHGKEPHKPLLDNLLSQQVHYSRLAKEEELRNFLNGEGRAPEFEAICCFDGQGFKIPIEYIKIHHLERNLDTGVVRCHVCLGHHITVFSEHIEMPMAPRYQLRSAIILDPEILGLVNEALNSHAVVEMLSYQQSGGYVPFNWEYVDASPGCNLESPPPPLLIGC